MLRYAQPYKSAWQKPERRAQPDRPAVSQLSAVEDRLRV
jgi:hypothetical protein